MKANRRYIYDIILVMALLAVFLSLYFFIYKRGGSDGGGAAYIVETYEGNRLVGSYDLSKDGEYSIGGGTNIIRIEDGCVYMHYADCPDGWCKHQGKINIVGERITCLPNEVMVIIREAGR